MRFVITNSQGLFLTSRGNWGTFKDAGQFTPEKAATILRILEGDGVALAYAVEPGGTHGDAGLVDGPVAA
ncbi:MAG TPA: hypothetical protein VGT24_06375 [Candidatus Acidoferrales bacterium]|nr:hypothetical protein [Candidatus Acidoferrales bacterium]